MSPNTVLRFVNAEPFRKFRIMVNSGRAFEVRHPEMVTVGRDVLVLTTAVSDKPGAENQSVTVSLLLVESISNLDAPVA